MDVVAGTERLVLRRLTKEDSEHLVELDGDPEVMRYTTGGVPTPRIRIETAVLPAMLRDYGRYPGFGAFAGQRRDDGEFIGWFMLLPRADSAPDEAELGYRLRQPAWGKGYATEGSRALLRYGFTERGLRRAFAETMTVNARSRRVLEKLGMRLAYTFFPPYAPIEGSEHGEVRYTLDRDAWEAASERTRG
jgi:RimJ/RimL family protein N-acetyltransferase